MLARDPDPLLLEIWYLMESRIAPQLLLQVPSSGNQTVQGGTPGRYLLPGGDLEKAIEYLNILVRSADPDSMEFQQAGELLNIIEWRRKYHPEWTGPGKVRRISPGRCAPHVAHAMALMQSAFDKDALDLTDRIITQGDRDSDDIRMAHLVRAGIYICTGRIDEGEAELEQNIPLVVSAPEPDVGNGNENE